MRANNLQQASLSHHKSSASIMNYKTLCLGTSGNIKRIRIFIVVWFYCNNLSTVYL